MKLSKLIIVTSLFLVFLVSCASDETTLVIEEITLISNEPVNEEILLEIDGQEKLWQPEEPIIYELEDVGAENTITVFASENDYELASASDYNIKRGERLTLTLVVRRIDDVLVEDHDPVEMLMPDDPEMDDMEETDPEETEEIEEEPEVEVEEETEPHLVETQAEPDYTEFIFTREEDNEEFTVGVGESAELPDGNYTWQATAPGYVTHRAEDVLELEEGEFSELEVGLTEKRTVQINSDPEGAEVVLVGDTHGREYSGETPAQIEVKPDFYRWELNREGYERLWSGDYDESDFDFVSGNQTNYQIERSLSSLDIQEIIESADENFEEGDYNSALNEYQQIPEPASCSGSPGYQYRHAQNRIGWIYLHDSANLDIDNAVENYENLLECDPYDYTGLLYMGKTQVQLGNLSDAREYLNEILGPLQMQIPSDDRSFITSKARYWIAMSYYEEYQRADSHDDRIRIGPNAVSYFSDFLANANEDDPKLQSFISDAEDYVSQIRNDLQ